MKSMSQEMKDKKSKTHDKAAIEALLFATNGLTLDDIAKRTGMNKKAAEEILEELELEHETDERGIHVIQEGSIWKMSVKPEMTVQIRDLLPPDLPAGLTKTLAIIAAKKPVRQSIIVKIRGNKAYDHVKKLVKLGFITAERRGNTQILDLTQRFFDYFRVTEENLKSQITEKTEKGENDGKTEEKGSQKEGN